MKTIFKSILSVLMVTLLIFILLLVFYLPQTDIYDQAQQACNKFSSEKGINYLQKGTFFRSGFILGYISANQAEIYWILLIASIIISIGLVYIFMKAVNYKHKNFILSDPYEFIKNILSTILMFYFGIFNRRASQPLSYYFKLPVRSKIIGLFAYALIFFAVALLYGTPSNAYNTNDPMALGYLWALIPVSLIAGILFVQSFQKNYQRTLFWISLSIVFLLFMISAYTSAKITVQLKDPVNFTFSLFDFINIKDFIINLLIILAFSFYIELMRTTSEEKSLMEAEIRIAEKLQRELIPKVEMKNDKLELFGKINSAKAVGGDYIDVIPLDAARTVTAVADVSGHSIASGLLMSMLKTAFRTELKYVRDPASLAASLNKTIHENKDKSMFISFLFTAIDHSHKTVSLINGGHPPLLRYSHKNNSFVEHRTGDLALGLNKDAVFKTEIIPYESGDIFILYSDGLSETVNAHGEEWGTKAIESIVKTNYENSVSDIYNAIIENADKFRGSAARRDDLTLMIIKMK
ncbi:MAG: PP2C family protein-serine/threonine phosphatase [Calditrichaceae bacterium]|nr:PP2C family protein-serine/threonine phosphatase [Calditrichaceae bacterium]